MRSRTPATACQTRCAAVLSGCVPQGCDFIMCCQIGLRVVGEEHAWLWTGSALSAHCAAQASKAGESVKDSARSVRDATARGAEKSDDKVRAASTCVAAERGCTLCSRLGSMVPALSVTVVYVGMLYSPMLLQHGLYCAT